MDGVFKGTQAEAALFTGVDPPRLVGADADAGCVEGAGAVFAGSSAGGAVVTYHGQPVGQTPSGKGKAATVH